MPNRTRTLLAALAFAAAAAPSAASASVVSYEGPTDNEVLVLRGAPGEADRVGVQLGPIPDSVGFYDPDEQITVVPEQCARNGYSVQCHAPNGARLELGDGDDSAYVSSDVTVDLVMYGGPGADELSANDEPNQLFGDAGDDTLEGSGGADVLDGGDGNDTLDGYSGADRLAGGAGDDLLHPDGYERPSADVVDGGAGIDRIESDYLTRDPDDVEPLVAFTLSGGADDGRPGEGDDVRAVERFTFAKGARFVGTDADEYVKLHQAGESGELAGMGGADELRGGDGADRIDGGAGPDVLDGGYGDDQIVGGAGPDRISADLAGGDCGPLWCKYPSGNDVVDARDGEADSVSCGPGTDRVLADSVDTVAPDCETVDAAKPDAGVVGGTCAKARATLRKAKRRLARAQRAARRSKAARPRVAKARKAQRVARARVKTAC